MIDRKKRNTLFCTIIRQSQHTIYCAMGPKSFSAVKDDVRRRVKDTPKQCIRGASGGFFQIVDWKTEDPQEC